MGWGFVGFLTPFQSPTRPGMSPENMTAGMLVVIPAIVLSGVVLLSGARHLPREMALMVAKLKSNPKPVPRAAPPTALR